jgi:hypothetical protein
MTQSDKQTKIIWTDVFGSKKEAVDESAPGQLDVTIDVSSNGTTSVQPDELVKVVMKRFAEMKKA